MLERLAGLITVLGVGTVVASVSKRVGVPYNVALVVVGLLLVLTNVLPSQALDPALVLIVILPLLVFEGALFADADGMARAARPILILALPGVALSLLGTAAVATQLLGLSFSVALLLGALLAITDTVSVLLAFRSVLVPRRLQAIMEGESLFNDGTALALVSVTTAVIVRGQFDAASSAKALGIAIGGGIVVGAAVGVLGATILRRLPDHLTATLASLVLVFAASIGAERLHASPVIAVVVAGVMVGRTARRALSPTTALSLRGFWETIGFVLNVLVFALVGMQLRADELWREAGSIALALVALHVGRAVAVYVPFGALRWFGPERVPLAWQHVMVVGNIKGALSMAAVLALPSTVPEKSRLVSIVFGVTFVTLLTQALPLRRFLGWLGVTLSAGDAALEAAKVSLIGARRGQATLDELLAAGLVSQRDHAERRAALQREVLAAERRLRSTAGEATAAHATTVSVLLAQKSALLDAAQRGLVSEHAVAERVAHIDGELVALADLEHET